MSTVPPEADIGGIVECCPPMPNTGGWGFRKGQVTETGKVANLTKRFANFLAKPLIK